MTFFRSLTSRFRRPARSFLGRSGQTTIEYVMTTLMILLLFTSMYRFLQGQTRKLFGAAASMILRAYY